MEAQPPPSAVTSNATGPARGVTAPSTRFASETLYFPGTAIGPAGGCCHGIDGSGFGVSLGFDGGKRRSHAMR